MIVTILALMLTVAAYALSRWISYRSRSPLAAPVLLSTLLVMAVLRLSGAGLESYQGAEDTIGWWLGPATVSLAVPLYRYRQILIENAVAVFAAIAGGTLVAMLSAIALARMLGLAPSLQGALGLKTATAPVAIALAPTLQASGPIVAGMVVASALFGTIAGPALLSRLGIRQALARGLALGTISSGQGVAQAFGEGKLCGASASLAMALAALAVAAFTPVLSGLLKF